MGILNTLHDGAFSNDDPLTDVYLKMRQGETEEKPEEPKVEPENQEVLKEKTVDAKIQLDPVGKEDGDVDNDGDKDSSDKYLMKRRKAIQQAISKNKKQKKSVPEMKLSKEQDKVDTKPKLKEMSADKAYSAMDKADKQSRGEMSVTDPKKAKKRAKQAQKFADYSIKKTLNKEEFDAVHEYALEENMKRDIMGFGAKLQAYSDKSGGIDKDYFSKIAKTAMSGRMPDAKDVEGDTDPRDFVLKMMSQSFPKETMKAYVGLSPSFDQYMKEAYDVKTAKTKYGKITVKSFDSHDDAKSHLASMNKKGHKGIISQDGKPVKEHHQKDANGEPIPHDDEESIQEVKKSDYQLYHKDFSSAMQHAYAVAKKRGYTVDPEEIDNKVATGPRKPSSGKTNRYILGTDKKQNLHVQVANLDNKRFELNMYIESVQEEEMKTLKDLTEVESAYADKIAAYKKAGGTIKKHSPDAKRIKKATDSFKAKLAKTMKIQSAQDEKEKAEKEANKQQDEGHSMPMDKGSVMKRVDMFKKLRDKKASQGYQKTDLANEELTSAQKKLPPALQQAIAKKMQKKTEKNEEVSKSATKLNQVLENRRIQKSGAGEEGTDELVKKYKKDTPGQIEEGNVEMQNNDAFRRMEGLVEYLMGLSIDDPGKFTVHPIPETNGYRLEYANCGLATVTEADWKNHFGNVSGEDFIELCKEFGMNVTTSGTEVIDPAPSQVDGVTESEQVDITKNSATSTPETVAADYADRYRMDNIVKLISKQIRGK